MRDCLLSAPFRLGSFAPCSLVRIIFENGNEYRLYIDHISVQYSKIIYKGSTKWLIVILPQSSR